MRDLLITVACAALGTAAVLMVEMLWTEFNWTPRLKEHLSTGLGLIMLAGAVAAFWKAITTRRQV